MSFAERLISEPQREKSGETGYERFDYQALWGLALIFEHHGSTEDYAIAFEFHDDIVLLNSAFSPTRARFYQVKTKDKGHWTLSDLYRRNARKNDPSGGKLPSHMGKLFSSYVTFPDETDQLNFVSNVPCAFLDAASGACHFTECDPATLAKFMTKLVAEYPGATQAAVGLIRYVRADLSLHDSSAHIKGKLSDFVLDQIGSVEYNPDTLYKTIVEECRTRSKYTGSVSNFSDLIKYKSITRSQVEGWLDQVRDRHALPDWAEISHHLTISGMELDEDDEIIWNGSGIVSGIGPEVAKLLDFKLTLPNRKGEQIVPPPAFCFLPFYVDQDIGWLRSWASFEGLHCSIIRSVTSHIFMRACVRTNIILPKRSSSTLTVLERT